MRNFIKLPFELKPLLQAYHHDVYTLGIVQGHNSLEKISPWLCGRYLNCFYGYMGGNDLFSKDPVDIWGDQDDIIWRSCFYMPATLEGFPKTEMLDLIRFMLDNRHYVTGRYNERFIPGKSAYQSWDYMHDFILYGYDDDRQVFFSAGYMGNGRCEGFEISYENLYQSVLNGLLGKYQFEFMLYNPEARFDLNLDRIAMEISDYVHSTSYRPLGWAKRIYGMDSVRMLQQVFLHETEKKSPYIDLRFTRSLMEHKYMQLFCMKHLKQQGILKNTDIALPEKNYNKACLIHNLGIKTNISRKREGCKRIATMIEEILEQEDIFFSKLDII